MFKLPKTEEERINNILKRAFDKESGKLNENDVRLTEDNPDGRKILLNGLIKQSSNIHENSPLEMKFVIY